MKKVLLLIIASLSALSCKKREEISELRYPNASKLRIVEIIDSNSVAFRAFRRQIFSYDELGRVTFVQNTDLYTSVARLEYAGGKFSKMTINREVDDDNTTVSEISRNENGLISSVLVKIGPGQTGTYFNYDNDNNLLESIREYLDINNGDIVTTDSTKYSDFVNHRWTHKTFTQTLRFAEGGHVKVILSEKRVFDSDSRVVSKRTVSNLYNGDSTQELGVVFTLASTDTLQKEYSYFEKTQEQDLWNATQNAFIAQYYTSNLDVYELLGFPMYDYPYGVKTSIDRSSKGSVSQTNTIIRSENYQGFPTELLQCGSTSCGGVKIRYEIE